MTRWENLFLSCDGPGHCGHHKDQSAEPYDPADLVKPDEDDPDRFFYFHSDGTVRVRSGACVEDQERAEVTIKVLNLTHGRLRDARRRVASRYLDDVAELETWSRELVSAYFEEMLKDSSGKPHSAVVRHLFRRFRQPKHGG